MGGHTGDRWHTGPAAAVGHKPDGMGHHSDHAAGEEAGGSPPWVGEAGTCSGRDHHSMREGCAPGSHSHPDEGCHSLVEGRACRNHQMAAWDHDGLRESGIGRARVVARPVEAMMDVSFLDTRIHARTRRAINLHQLRTAPADP